MCRSVPCFLSQSRNTVIVKRVHKPLLVKVPGKTELETPQKLIDKQVVHSDDDKWMIYEIEEMSQPHHEVKVILLRNVDDFGKKGQIVTTLFNKAHSHLLLPGFAVYHNKENLELLKDIVIPEDQEVDSSPTIRPFLNFYSRRAFDVCLNGQTPWTIEKWHIKATLRRHNVWVSEDQIDIPGGQISGPDPSLEDKEFVAVLTINNHEKLDIRCRIHHLPTEDSEPLVPRSKSWHVKLAEPVWEEERQRLSDMNKAFPNKKQREDKQLAEDIVKWDLWKNEREQRLA